MLDKLRADRKIQPFGPGQKELLAQQLAYGFGGGPEKWMEQLSQIYQPYKLPGGGKFIRADDTGMLPADQGDDKNKPDRPDKKPKNQPFMPFGFGYNFGH